MAVKDLLFRILGEDTVSPVFKKIAVEAEASAGQVAAAYREAGAEMEASMGAAKASGIGGFKRIGAAAMTGSLLVVGAAGLIGAKAVSMGADFQTSIVRLNTSAGEAKKNLGTISQGIIDMAPRVGQTTQTLADGIYTVESAGYHGAGALKVLAASSKGASIEGASLAAVSDAVTSAMVDYHLPASQAAKVTNVLIAATARGKTTLEGLASAFPNVAAAAAAVGVSLPETAAAIATMTSHGVDAAKAGTYLRQVLLNLASGGTKQAQSTFAGIGLSANDLSKELGHQGLAATIGTIQDALTKKLTPAGLEAVNVFKSSADPLTAYKRLMGDLPPSMQTTFGALTKMFGGVKSLQGILMLGGENLKTFRDNTAAVQKAAHDGGHEVLGWSEYQDTLNAKVNIAKAGISALATSIGLDLIPYVTKLIGYVGQATTFLAEHKTVVEYVGVAVLGTAVAVGILGAAIFALSSPIVLIVGGLAALTAGFVYAYQKSEQFRDIVNQAVADVKEKTKAFVTEALHLWHEYGADIIAFAKGFLGGLVQEFKGYFQIITGVFNFWSDLFHGKWGKLWGDIKQILTGALNVIEGVLRVAWSAIKLQAEVVWGIIKDDLRGAWSDIKGIVLTGVQDVVGFFRSIPSRLRDLLGSFKSAGSDLVGAVFHGIESAASSVGGFVGNLASQLVSAVRSAINSALNLPLSINFDKGPIHIHATVIPALAEGGITLGPQIAMIGEAGPEMVLPLRDPRARSMLGLDEPRDDGRRHDGPAGPMVNIEHYHEAGLTSAQVAKDLLFLAA